MRYLLFVFVCMALGSNAQMPQVLNFQTIVRDADGERLLNQSVSLKIDILNDKDKVQYSETHSATTDGLGALRISIGEGTGSDSFDAIDWSTEGLQLRPSLDVDGGEAFVEMDPLPILAVPYALHASVAETVLNKEDDDADPTNEIQELSLSGATLTLEDGGSVDLSGIKDDLFETEDNNTAVGTNSLSENTTGANNTTLGVSAGGANTEGSNNLYMGHKAGATATTGADNVYLGKGAGELNITGSRNVFIGYQAGLQETSSDKLYIDNSSTTTPLIYGDFENDFLRVNGQLRLSGRMTVINSGRSVYIGHDAGRFSATDDDLYNVFVGDRAGSLNEDAKLNTAVGGQAMRFNTTGAGNTAMGYAALYTSSTGNDNTAIGRLSLWRSETAIQNTAVGAFTLYDHISGSFNSVLGSYSGLKVTSGSNNLFLGSSSGRSTTTGSNNAFVGTDAGRNNLVGSDNVYLGAEAGKNATGNGNVFIGRSAGSGELGDGYLYIDNSDTSSPLIYGNFSTDVVQVNGDFFAATVTENSDRRFKTQIEPLGYGLHDLIKLDGKSYYFDTARFPERGFNDQKQLGLIAQEVQDVIPEVVLTDEDGYYSVSYTSLVPLLIESIKELKAANDEMSGRVATLEAAMTRLTYLIDTKGPSTSGTPD